MSEASAVMLELVEVPGASLRSYEPIVGEAAVAEIGRLAAPLRGARVLHLNATRFGGGVAEILPTLTGLMRDVGLDAEWRVIPGDGPFFAVTKALHSGLQGMPIALDEADRRTYATGSRDFAAAFEGAYDFVVVHDPQPAALRSLLPAAPGRWIWRCHIDLSTPDPTAWAFVRPWVEAYDAAVFTLREYVQPDLAVRPVAIVAPSIDPLAVKNRPLEPSAVDQIVTRYGVDPARPLMVQVSRFDPWKDPEGVIDVYRRVKREVRDLQLVLAGSLATDDPEGWSLYKHVLRYAGLDEGIMALTNLDGVGALEVNAFQRAADVVLQKSIREGFGLTVSEALWKGVPVVGGRVGGIPLQIGDDEAGRLVSSVDEAAAATLELLRDPDLRRTLGQVGRERVRRHFLSTRNLRDYLALFTALRTGDHSLVPAGIAP